jgi:hypothetical protein
MYNILSTGRFLGVFVMPCLNCFHSDDAEIHSNILIKDRNLLLSLYY